MRLRPILAIAMRDLRMELRGWRGLLFGSITAGLLVPVSTVPLRPSDITGALPPPSVQVLQVSGDVPDGLDSKIMVVEDAHTQLKRTEAGATVVYGPIPRPVRQAMDLLDPAPVTLEIKPAPLHLPGRTLLLALISSSVMMGALSESIAGERARRTLSTLLAAAVSRAEIAVGKWLAWTFYGAGAAMLAALVAVATGAAEPGLWLLPLPWVPATTVALGLYLVRRAKDVVAGATISLRVLPAVLMGTGLLAWFLGRTHPALGAAVPLGGALLTAGATWPGAAPPLIATGVTASTTALLLYRTAMDLSDDPGGESSRSPMFDLTVITMVAGAAWLAPILGPQLWALAGNATLTASLSRPTGVLAGGAGLALLAGLRMARDDVSTDWFAPTRAWFFAVPAGVLVTMGALTQGLVPVSAFPAMAEAHERLDAALQPDTLGPLIAVIVGQELVFRGLLQDRVGPWLALLAFVIATGPLDPLRTLAVGLPLTLLSQQTRSPLPGMAARLLASVLLLASPSVPPVLALSFVVGLSALWVARLRRRTSP